MIVTPGEGAGQSPVGPVILLSAPEMPPGALSEHESMRFRLTYDGPLQASQRDPEGDQADPIALHKQKIRRVFHGQLKELWETNSFLSTHRVDGVNYMNDTPGNGPSWASSEDEKIPLREAVAGLYHENGYQFVPLVREDWHLMCRLDILFLRRDRPGSLIQAGDIDNRIKTLIDALRRPRNRNELRGSESPGDGETPFYVLLEDDKQVSALTVETDTLLDPKQIDHDRKQVRLVITVEIIPYYNTMLNLSFV